MPFNFLSASHGFKYDEASRAGVATGLTIDIAEHGYTLEIKQMDT